MIISYSPINASTPARVESGAETSAPRASVARAYSLYVTASERRGSEVYAPLSALARRAILPPERWHFGENGKFFEKTPIFLKKGIDSTFPI